MSRHPHLYPATGVVSSPFPPLSNPLAAGWALWRLGMSLARSGRLPAVAGILAPWLSPPFTTLRERVRAPYRETPANAGTHRTQLELQDCWARWLAWVLEGGAGRQLASAREATTRGPRCGGLALSIVSRGCAVAVAWTILPATAKPPWQPEWLARLKHFCGLVPADWRVVVADRGLEATWRFPVRSGTVRIRF